MTPPRAVSQDNLPDSLRAQLQVASYQVRGNPGQPRGQSHHRQEQLRYQPPQLNVSSYPGGQRPNPARGHLNQRRYLSSRHGRGRPQPGFHDRNSQFANVSRPDGSSDPHLSRALTPIPPFVTQEAAHDDPTAPEIASTADSVSSSITLVPSVVDSKDHPDHPRTIPQISDNQILNSGQVFTSSSTSSSNVMDHFQKYRPQSEASSQSYFSSISLPAHQRHSQSIRATQSSKSFQPLVPMSDEAPPGLYERAMRGAYRGARHGPSSTRPTQSYYDFTGFMTDQNAPLQSFVSRRPAYNHRSGRALWDPNTHQLQDIERQCAYLIHLVRRETKNKVSEEELSEKESFRKKLERIIQLLIVDYAKEKPLEFDPQKVKLKCYGSLASGFAVPSSDMDLLLMFPADQGSVGRVEAESGRMIEEKLLEQGYGARLLTKTRVPILRVCQSPSPELLSNLRVEREKWDEEVKEEEKEAVLRSTRLDPSRLPSTPTTERSDAATATFAELDAEPSMMPLPLSPVRARTDLEFKNGVGIQCDINFSNRIAIHNTALLRCYCKCDSRVRPMGLFVKEWSKARKINTPYYGTLSSYGYIMMVLHYLMNIAQPPVIPNLQHLAKDDDAWNNHTDVELFEGYDVRFIRDEALLEQRANSGQVTQNRENLGSLLRGFFCYYTDPRGFHWVNQVISLRTQGGIVTKVSKDWTGMKRAGTGKTVVLRYVLAIEDPFEIDHNIARTVGYAGVGAIRSELKRAWEIVSKVDFTQGRWLWFQPNGLEGEDLFAKADDRGDLLRKDQEEARERYRKYAAGEANARAKPTPRERSNGDRVPRVNGMSLHPRRSNPESDHDIARAHGHRLKLTKPGRGGQNPQNSMPRTSFKSISPANREREHRTFREGLIRTQNTLEGEKHGVLKWVECTVNATGERSAVDQNEPQAPPATFSGSARPPTEREKVQNNIVSSEGTVSISKTGEETIHETAVSSMVIPSSSSPTLGLQTPVGRGIGEPEERILARERNGSTDRESQCLDRPSQFDQIADLRAKRILYFSTKLGEKERASTAEGTRQGMPRYDSKDSETTMTKAVSDIDDQTPSCPLPKSEVDISECQNRPDDNRRLPETSSTSDYTMALSSNDPDVIHEPEPMPEKFRTTASAASLNNLQVVIGAQRKPVVSDHGLYHHQCSAPVPRVSNFQFDPAQLRDLERISKGGDGCARPVEESC